MNEKKYTGWEWYGVYFLGCGITMLASHAYSLPMGLSFLLVGLTMIFGPHLWEFWKIWREWRQP